MAKFIVIVMKVKCGVSFLLDSKKPGINSSYKVRTETRKESQAINQAIEEYRAKVNEAFSHAGMLTSYTATQFDRTIARKSGERSRLMELEPWGFVVERDGEPCMGNTGSTPTPGRAKALQCYQAPLAYDPESKEIRATFTVEV